ncbi:MAG: glycogen/starch/alpha-glucan phosphorylase [Oscillospiraceae bacterium]|nr:glycogen/starch/alpha-glucan phosphorylase [Oscillospiraceae bacterium]
MSKLKQTIKQQLTDKIYLHFGRRLEEATKGQIWQACALVIRDEMSAKKVKAKRTGGREVHYLSMEFLLGRSMTKNAYNLGLLDDLTATLKDLGYDAADIFEVEPDAALGNGGLGRLAACYLDSMTTTGLNATGYSLCYEYGVFAQKIVNGEQVETPDVWLDKGEMWLLSPADEVQEVQFGGHVVETRLNGRTKFTVEGATTVLAVPRDMLIGGYKTDNVNTLRLWAAKSPVSIDMPRFFGGEYVKSQEQEAAAAAITKLLYPEDNHFEGKSLRLRQQYFFVSATMQSICKRHKAKHGTLENLHKMHVFHINDTHPALAIPELLRILIDGEGMCWDDAWEITSQCFAYTNHTILSEALECWPQSLIEHVMPRIWQILREINKRYLHQIGGKVDENDRRDMAIVWDGVVRMANLCVFAAYSVNGVSALHSDILKEDIFRREYAMTPKKFTNVTNGVDHRRWLAQVNPKLDGFIQKHLHSDDYLLKCNDLEKLVKLPNSVLQELADIKREDKIALANHLNRTQGALIDENMLFDVQVKRLHEYKRQLLNVLHILTLYQSLRDNSEQDFVPRAFFFGAKAASGYYAAKRIIALINSVAKLIDNDPVVRGRLKVVFVENYRVSLAELIMPATELSEQISLAGKEASGTGNMKFMFNGALTIGTMDGANVEMCEAAGEENMFIFGLREHEVEAIWREGRHDPGAIYRENKRLASVMDMIATGLDVPYEDIAGGLIHNDPYMLLTDYDSYVAEQAKVSETYCDAAKWNAMSLANIAAAGRFASDRSIKEYAKGIWRV